MEKYWKLLNLYTNEYTTHESEEEVNHIIDFICKDMQESRETIRQEIKTPFPNYDFNHVVVYDDTAIRHFVYFFDTVEEQCDDFEERVDTLTKAQDRIIDEEYELTCDNDELKRRLEIKEAYNHHLQSQCHDLKTKLSILEAGLKESERNVDFWKTRCEKAEKFLEENSDLEDDIYERKMEYEKEIEERHRRCLELKQDHRRLEALLAAEQRLKNHYVEENGDMMTAIHQYCNKCGTFTCDDCPLRHF